MNNRKCTRRGGRSVAVLVAAVMALAPTTAAAAPSVAGPAVAPPGGSWIVTLVDGAPVDAVAQGARAAVRQRFTQALTGFTAVLSPDQVERLRSDRRVRSVVEDSVVARLPRDIAPAAPPPLPSTQVVPDHIKRIGGAVSRTARIDGVDQAVNADVAVLDGGVGPHPDLNVVAAVDCVGDGRTFDSDGHGTEVAGMAAARDNRIGTVGAAPGARVWNVRIVAIDGSLSESSLLCGLEYVRRNAAQIDTAVMAFEDSRAAASTTCGIGRVVGPGGRPTIGVADPVHLAVCRVRAAGVLPVAQAGNQAADAANTVPASYPEVVAVSAMTDTDGRPGGRGPASPCYATQRDDTFAEYSSYGRVVDLSAPGTCVVTTYPGGLYVADIGTSFSTALVAGAAALLEARDPRANADSMTATLQRTKERAALPGDPDGVAEGVVDVATF